MGRRVLVTGLATFWGGRLARMLEQDPDVDVIVGVDTREPTERLERTEFVRTDESYSILARIVRATRVDTVLHTFLVVDPGAPAGRHMHEINVIGTMNLCAAATAPGSTVQTLVVKSSTVVYGLGRQDPRSFAETTPPSRPLRTRLERSLAEVESYVGDVALDNPAIDVSVLRFTNVVGPDLSSTFTRLLDARMVPSVLGFDPCLHVVHEDDVVRALRFAMDRRLRGTYNVAGDGALPWSEIVAFTGAPRLRLPPTLTQEAARVLRLAGGPRCTQELLDLLRFGRGIDNRRFKAAGFHYLFDTPGAIADHVAATRLHRTVRAGQAGHRFQEDVETFFRRSPAVISERDRP